VLKKKSGGHGIVEMITIRKPCSMAIGEMYRSNSCTLLELAMEKVSFEMEFKDPLPHFVKYYELPLTFSLPGTQEVIEATADVDTIHFGGSPTQRIYGLTFRLKDIPKEKKTTLKDFIKARKESAAS
jgi:hypothetical protein